MPEAKEILVRDGPAGFASDLGNGLMMVIEALRMAALMAGPSGLAKGVLASYPPLAMAPGVWSTVQAGVAGVHVGCARTRMEGRAYRRRVELFKQQGEVVWRRSNRLVELVRQGLGEGAHPCDLWLDGGAIELLSQLASALLESPPELPAITDHAVSETLDAAAAVRQYRRKR